MIEPLVQIDVFCVEMASAAADPSHSGNRLAVVLRPGNGGQPINLRVSEEQYEAVHEPFVAGTPLTLIIQQKQEGLTEAECWAKLDAWRHATEFRHLVLNTQSGYEVDLYDAGTRRGTEPHFDRLNALRAAVELADEMPAAVSADARRSAPFSPMGYRLTSIELSFRAHPQAGADEALARAVGVELLARYSKAAADPSAGYARRNDVLTPSMVLAELERRSRRTGWVVELIGCRIVITPPPPPLVRYEPEPDDE